MKQPKLIRNALKVVKLAISNKFTSFHLNAANDNSNNKLINNNKINSNKEKGEQTPIADQNSMNGSLLNASMNGSSIQFLNKSNKLNLNNNNTIRCITIFYSIIII